MSALNPKLPFLPGYQPSISSLSKKDHSKPHVFDVDQGIMICDKNKKYDTPFSPLGNLSQQMKVAKLSKDFDPRAGDFKKRDTASLPFSTMPAWVAYDRKVCRFYAFFRESVHANSVENYRIRRCVIFFYLDDNTVHIAETKTRNSGLPQGVFLKRDKQMLTDKVTGEDRVLTLNDLFIGNEIDMYCRTFRIVDCDGFTRKFYEANSKILPALKAPETYPTDPFEKSLERGNIHRTNFKKMKNALKDFMEARLGNPAISQTRDKQKFLDFDRKVLRFYSIWDDPKLYGERRPFIVHYFLADDTVEVLEVRQNNNGRDNYPAMMKRGKLPIKPHKACASVADIGARLPDDEFVTERMLRTGNSLNVFGRTLDLCAVDYFTFRYYKEVHGVEQNQSFPTEYESEIVPVLYPPPHNGFGTEEDSLSSFLYLVPKVPRKDFKKMMENDGQVIRYLSKFPEGKGSVQDVDRRFIITYFMTDDTVSIYEQFKRNSGFIGGKFMERCKIKNPKSDNYFQWTDFVPGNVLTINKFQFELVEPDTYTKNLVALLAQGKTGMRVARPGHVSLDNIVAKIKRWCHDKSKRLTQVFREIDVDNNDYIEFDEFNKFLKNRNFFELSEEEVSYLLAQFDTNNDRMINLKEFATAVSPDSL